jgi:hypothetical protein
LASEKASCTSVVSSSTWLAASSGPSKQRSDSAAVISTATADSTEKLVEGQKYIISKPVNTLWIKSSRPSTSSCSGRRDEQVSGDQPEDATHTATTYQVFLARNREHKSLVIL